MTFLTRANGAPNKALSSQSTEIVAADGTKFDVS